MLALVSRSVFQKVVTALTEPIETAENAKPEDRDKCGEGEDKGPTRILKGAQLSPGRHHGQA